MKTLIYGSADDWAGVWVNGKIRYQNHSIQQNWWLELLREGPFRTIDCSDEPWCYEMADKLMQFEDLDDETYKALVG